jgi:hypothetical protein
MKDVERVCAAQLRRPTNEEGHSAQLSGHALQMRDVEVLRGSTSVTTRGKTQICGVSAKP